ncbi:hypothetical protein Nepgr_012060 [Nepenthes gracilis]|uniref:Uncharacterized protein n=1 Tax=Nepenthes gracilis TaxID=150966 RepID=A0AAD3SGG0_NEPGR|nr:hypothetical protein Nepgr_012060 [Nepenthes gracilis]
MAKRTQGVGESSKGPVAAPSSLADCIFEEGADMDDESSAFIVEVSNKPVAEESIEPVYVPTLVEHDVPVATTILPKELAPGPFAVLVGGSSDGGQSAVV